MKLLRKIHKREKGQVLILVLILLLLGALIIAPLMGFMSTGLIAGQVYEERMAEAYAADAGVEYGIYKIKNNDASLPSDVGNSHDYGIIAVINDKDIAVEITKVYEWGWGGTSEEFLFVLLGEGQISSADHADWFVISTEIDNGKYIITITYQGEDETQRLKGLGAWFEGVYEYVFCSASGITGDSCNGDYTPKTLDGEVAQPYEGGTAFVWEWEPPDPDYPLFTQDEPGNVQTQTFEFTPVQHPDFHFAWVEVLSADIWVSSNLENYTIWKVTATATDSSTGKQTEVISYVSSSGTAAPYAMDILTWEVSLQ